MGRNIRPKIPVNVYSTQDGHFLGTGNIVRICDVHAMMNGNQPITISETPWTQQEIEENANAGMFPATYPNQCVIEMTDGSGMYYAYQISYDEAT